MASSREEGSTLGVLMPVYEAPNNIFLLSMRLGPGTFHTLQAGISILTLNTTKSATSVG